MTTKNPTMAILKVPLREIAVDAPYYEAGGSTFHVHTCIDAEHPHPWRCNSPYCHILTGLCPDHGGLEPVRIGEEPWRGR